MPKPSDFFVGVIDFFAVLLPGASLIYLLQPLIVTSAVTPWLPASPTQGWVVFLVLAYIAGHLLHAIGSGLLDDYVYGAFYLPRCRPSHSRAAKLIRQADAASLRKDTEAASTLLARVHLTTNVNPQGTNYYDWCLSDVRVNSPSGAVEVDRLQADSKFFRSMAFVFVVAASVGVREALVWVSVGAVALMIFAIWRFCDLRWEATKRVYEYYLLLHVRAQGRGSGTAMRLPPFHSLGEENGHFYAVAYVPGVYIPPSGKARDEAFFVLSFSASESYTRFSVSTVSPTGEMLQYSRGTDELDSAEYAMLRAWREQHVPLHAWRFFPSAAIEAAAFTDDIGRVAYEAARRRVARIIVQARTHLWTQRQFPVQPLFRFDEKDIPEPMASTPEYEDIMKCLTDDQRA